MSRFILLSLILLVHVFVHAGVTVVSTRQKGAYSATSNPGGIQTGSTSYLHDDQYPYMIANPATWGNAFTNCNLENRVILRYEESARVYYGTPWSLAVQCTLKKWNSSGVTITPDEVFTLTIDYDPAAGTTYNDKDVYVSTDPGYKVQLIVGTITKTGAISSSAIPSDIVLETEIEVSRSYVFTQSSAPSAITNSGVQSDNTFNIRWAYLAGAESYDVEFLHVSSYDPVSVASPDFTRATRINTPNQNYTINLAYDDGYILYRVRGVGYDCGSDFRKEGVWSSTSTPVAVSNIDQYRNWQYSAVYSEDGKRKEVLSFYDGTGKPRQALTLNNTDNAVLVAETMYDYEGRPGIKTLPAPDDQLASQMMYYQSFSLVDGTSNPYTRKVFDTDNNFDTDYCTFGVVPGMDDASGASNYYSADNDLVNTDMYQALPDAQLYPFMQTVYGKDGRPIKQSAPGADHNIGSTHEVQSIYTSPTQERIDRLFGNEVGYAEHYNQVATIDPNGQMSMSYLDLSGRVIATSLIGQTPTNLDALASNTSVTLTENFNANNIFDQSTGTWMVNSFYMVSTTGTYTFTYTMTTEEFESICTDTTFDCVYDLEINIYDGCDNPMTDQETPDVLGTAYIIDHASVTTFTKTFTVIFSTPGVYRIEKKLSLNQQALNDAVAAYVALLPGDCFQTLSEITDSLNSAIDSTECQGCDSSCIVKALALGLVGTAYTNFVDSCQAHDCDVSAMDTVSCDGMLDVLAGDLTPGGQYFDNVPAGTIGTASTTWLTTYVWANGASSNWTNANFRDPSGNLLTNWSDVRTYWQNGWATQSFTATVTISSVNYNSLVEFHPEYCHYTWCTNHYDDQQFDLDLFTSDDDAWASSYPSGAGNAWTYNPVGANEEGTNMVNADPYFNSSPGSGDKTAMQNKINNYSGGASMWSYAGTQAGCTGCDAQWIMFRSTYIAEKAQYSRARQNTACGFLCDGTTPPDFYAGSCSGAETNGFMIRVPDLVGTLATQPSSTWNSGSQTLINCNTAATASVNFTYVNGSDYSSGLHGTIELLYDDGINPPFDMACGLATINGPSSMSAIASLVAAAINACVSTPYDFTAIVDPNDPDGIIITGPASLGSGITGNITVNLADGPVDNTSYKFSGGVTGSGIDCIENEHCFCKELVLYEAFYNATNDSSSYSGNYIVNHSTYTTAEAYIAYVLNSSYGTSVTSTQVAQWMAACDSSSMSDPSYGVAPALPEELDCENPVTPCMEDGYDITDYYAGVFYEQLIEQATQDFIQDYMDHCFGGLFSEDFDVTHPDREYHFTLYYYDQAGNLTRTVPPHAVTPLTGATLTQVNTYRTLGTGSAQYPTHKRSNNNLVTNYKYNSFNNLTESATPDGGTTLLYYDNIGRVVASENSKQTAMSNYVYSYTFYDAQGRVYEIGQVTSTTQISASVTATMSTWETFVAAGTREQVTSTYYDESLNATVAGEFYGGQNYLRKRVTSVTIEQAYDGNTATYDHATHFSYDVHGNVNELIQDYPQFSDHSQQYKHICYEYDLISSNVHMVMYQHDPYSGASHGDQFYHRYYYDADNRITNVYTSIDSIIWEQDQKYFYYLHGPLGRSETGDVKVQGSDYACTIHGWLKGVNSNVIDRTKDLGKDAQATSNTAYSSRAGLHSNIGLDAYGYVLGYYWDNSGRKDYKPINTAAQSLYTNSYTLTTTGDNLFNGNIKEMSTALSTPNGTGPATPLALIFNRYHYDQLNRIKSQVSFTGSSTSSYASLSSTGEYRNNFTYDAAGNIATQFRNGTTMPGQSMDDLTYYYYTTTGSTYTMTATGGAPTNGTNKLAYVDDAGTAGNYSDDLEDQSAGNYTYDAIGNLETDAQEEIVDINWNVYGKIENVERDASSTKSDLQFIYDSFGNRIAKIVKTRNGSGYEDQSEWLYTYYVRDASGKVMATYTRSYTPITEDEVQDKLELDETHLYGSSRIGIKDRSSENIYSAVNKTIIGITNGEYDISGIVSYTTMTNVDLATPERELGNKQYEFANYSGNVLVTLSDRKVQVQSGPNTDYFTGDIRSYTDYSAFGASLAARSGGTTYRYGLNGQEKDNEIVTGAYTAEFWQYDSRLGRRWNIDPVVKEWESPYATFSNNPIWFQDPFGSDTVVQNTTYTMTTSTVDKENHTDVVYTEFEQNITTYDGTTRTITTKTKSVGTDISPVKGAKNQESFEVTFTTTVLQQKYDPVSQSWVDVGPATETSSSTTNPLIDPLNTVTWDATGYAAYRSWVNFLTEYNQSHDVVYNRTCYEYTKLGLNIALNLGMAPFIAAGKSADVPFLGPKTKEILGGLGVAVSIPTLVNQGLSAMLPPNEFIIHSMGMKQNGVIIMKTKRPDSKDMENIGPASIQDLFNWSKWVEWWEAEEQPD